MINFLNKYFKHIILVILLLSFLFITIFSKNADPNSFIYTVLKPITVPVRFIKNRFLSITNFFSNLYIRRDTYIKLTKENQQLKSDLLDYNKVKYELKELKKDVDFFDRLKYSHIISKVIAADPNSWFKTVFLDKGIKDGVKRNHCVVNSSGIIGHITGVSDNISRLLMLIDSESAIGVRIKGTNYTGIAYGTNKDYLLLKYIPKYAEVKKGDIVITDNKSKIYPPFYPVGTVTNITKKETLLSLLIEIKPFVDFDNIYYVCIIQNEFLTEIEVLENSK